MCIIYCTYVCMYVCTYVRMYIYIYIHGKLRLDPPKKGRLLRSLVQDIWGILPMRSCMPCTFFHVPFSPCASSDAIGPGRALRRLLAMQAWQGDCRCAAWHLVRLGAGLGFRATCLVFWTPAFALVAEPAVCWACCADPGLPCVPRLQFDLPAPDLDHWIRR